LERAARGCLPSLRPARLLRLLDARERSLSNKESGPFLAVRRPDLPLALGGVPGSP
jgi:hypothetical protein